MTRSLHRKWLFWLVGAAYLALLIGVAVQSYSKPLYDFPGHDLFSALSWCGIGVLVVWRRQVVTKAHYGLAALLILVALACYPDTSRDAFRYLFDGEMIRLWHLSPYMNLPVHLPVDQYSAVFRETWWTQIPSPYGPLWQAVMVGINGLSGNHVAVGLILLKLLNLAALVGCGRYIYLITRRAWPAYCFVINPLVLIDTVHSPHTDILIALGLLAAYYYRDALRQGSLVGAASLIKLHTLIFVPFLARSRREAWRLMAATTVSLVLMLGTLEPILGFGWRAMVDAQKGGGVTGASSLIAYNLFPGVGFKLVSMLSYGLFLAGYLAVLAGYLRKKLSPLSALTLVSLLVPLTITGLVYPWHFIVPLVFLSLDERPWAAGAVLFITIFAFHAPLNVLTFLIFAALFVGGGYSARWVYRHLSKPPRLAVWLAKAYRNLYA